MEASTSGKLFLDHATSLKLHTGNLLIVNRCRLKNKCPSSPSEELQDCIRGTLSEWLATLPETPEQDLPSALDCTIPQYTEQITAEDREELRVSVKLFLTESDSSSIKNAVDMACASLGMSQLDSVIIAPPPLTEGEALTLVHLQPLWTELEQIVQSKKAASIGTSDLDKTQLEELYNWAQVKPSSNQVNLASCCVMPPDLTAFAKEFDIQLLTHNDSKGMLNWIQKRPLCLQALIPAIKEELLSSSGFQEAMQESCKDLHVTDWRLEWVLRYSIIVKTRGIIKAKGYLLHARKSTK